MNGEARERGRLIWLGGGIGGNIQLVMGVIWRDGRSEEPKNGGVGPSLTHSGGNLA